MRRGMGLPGHVWERGEAISLQDVSLDPSLPRSEIAAKAGVKGGVAFPLLTSSGVMGVIEFFANEERTTDRDMLELLRAVGGQVGEFVEAQSAEEALRESEARKGAILESALDCVITMDHEGRVVEFNPAAEATFGIPARDAIGREMAELIIPPELRDAHRAGLARYLETGEGTIVGRRIELRGMRSDGTEFPVELAVNRIAGHSPPLFTGYLRDITRRRQADDERERLLELERLARLDADGREGAAVGDPPRRCGRRDRPGTGRQADLRKRDCGAGARLLVGRGSREHAHGGGARPLRDVARGREPVPAH